MQMERAKTLTIYLNDAMRERAIAGKTNVFNRITAAFEMLDYQCLFKANSTVNLLASAADPGYSLFHLEDPFHPRALNLRRAYYYPFWRIEASAKRWEWTVAKEKFDPSEIDFPSARKFADFWRDRLFGSGDGGSGGGGYIYAPLQGRLLHRRPFQAMAPLDMLKNCLVADDRRSIHVSLHPREVYSEVEMAALRELVDRHARLKMVSGDSTAQVRGCDYIVTQNSGIALDGYFFGKPAILFAQIDFHHIAKNVMVSGVEHCFDNVLAGEPDYEKYLFWFLQLQSINAGRDDAEQQILHTVRINGWDV